MMTLSLIKLLGSIVVTLFLPGYFLLHALLKERAFSLSLEKLVFSFGLSIFVVDFLFILLNLLHVPITQFSSLSALIIFCLACFVITLFRKKEAASFNQPASFSFTSRQKILFTILFTFSILIRAIYVGQGSIPQTTDLGHHMYWAKSIVTNASLPDYGMPDFIIGEHIIFGIIGAISQIDFVSAMPVSVIFLINIFSLLSLCLVAFRINELLFSKKKAINISLIALLTIGVLYSISSPQAKFVSGGVIGNVLGNFFMPLILYTFVSGIFYAKGATKDDFLSRFYFLLFILFSATLAYTHHLTTFVFLFVFAGFALSFFLVAILGSRFNVKAISPIIGSYVKNLFSLKNILALLLFFVLIFFYPPSYLNPAAIDTAVGTPIKETRVGIDLFTLTLSTGPWRFFYSALSLLALGMITLTLLRKKLTQTDKETFQRIMEKILSICLASAWFLVLFIMSNRPSLLKIDIPSNRIASYLTLPSALLSAMAIYFLFQKSLPKLKRYTALLIFALLLGTGVLSGLADVSDSARDEVNVSAARQVYAASEYLREKTDPSDIILKDHIFLPADAWIKLFLMRDYKNPLSRSLLKRYEDVAKDRETCTRDMVAIPDSEVGRQCFEETNVKYIMLRTGFDTEQFENSPNFSKVYVSNDVVIYKKK